MSLPVLPQPSLFLLNDILHSKSITSFQITNVEFVWFISFSPSNVLVLLTVLKNMKIMTALRSEYDIKTRYLAPRLAILPQNIYIIKLLKQDLGLLVWCLIIYYDRKYNWAQGFCTTNLLHVKEDTRVSLHL